jgi:hypothetical protein
MRSLSGFGRLFPLLSFGLLAVLEPSRGAEPEPAGAVAIQAGKTAIDFRAGKTLVARYVIDPRAAKPYFWPLNALPGLAVTRSWPMEEGKGEAKDHVHQKSAWFCHGDVIPVGMDFKKHFKNVAGIDFWSEGKGHGDIVCVKVGEPKIDKNHGSITTTNEWRTAEGQKVMDETRTIHFYHFGKGSNLIVLDINLHASVCPIEFGDTKEGSLGVRVRESLRVDRGKGRLTNAEGKSGEGATVKGKGTNAEKKGCWGLVSSWCDYSGPVDDSGTVAGISVFADPDNPIDTAWHVRNYGLLAANPFGREKHAGFPDRKGKNDLVTIRKGEHLKLRYGLLLHAKDAKGADVAGMFKKFTELKSQK